MRTTTIVACRSLALVLLAGALAGCGGGASQDESVAAPVSAIADVPTTPAAAAKVELGDSEVADATTVPVAKADPDDGLAQAGDGVAASGELLAKAPAQADPLAAPPDVKKAPAGAEQTASGLQSRVLQAGWGSRHPTATDTVVVHYTGWTRGGKRFDSSVERGEPASFPLDHVIDGWTEGVQLMVEGEKRRFWIPAELAYGNTPQRPGAPAGPLVFDIELLEIK